MCITLTTVFTLFIITSTLLPLATVCYSLSFALADTTSGICALAPRLMQSFEGAVAGVQIAINNIVGILSEVCGVAS